jgi:hypothetical protein
MDNSEMTMQIIMKEARVTELQRAKHHVRTVNMQTLTVRQPCHGERECEGTKYKLPDVLIVLVFYRQDNFLTNAGAVKTG